MRGEDRGAEDVGGRPVLGVFEVAVVPLGELAAALSTRLPGVPRSAVLVG